MNDNIEVTLDKKAQEFMRVLRQHSSDKNDPVSEWVYCRNLIGGEFHGEADGKRCICTTPIFNLHYIRNRISGMTIEIGCECVKRWSLGPKCEGGCGRSLGSLAKRKRENSWLCRTCNDVGNTIFLGRGPFYSRKFKEVVKNRWYVTKMMNLSLSSENLRKFQEYAATVWQIEDAR